MKRRKTKLLAVGVAVLFIVLWAILHPKPKSADQLAQSKPSPTPQAAAAIGAPPLTQDQVEKNKAVIKQVENAFATPIAFYGRVIDQNGAPVGAASVGYAPIDNFLASTTRYTGVSDANGYFSIEGVKGVALSVGVGKQGYYAVDDKYDKSPSSAATFAYGMGPDSYRQSPPTKDKPAIFVLHKMGKTEPLVRVEKSTRIPKDGTSVSVDLMNGSLSSDGSFRVEAWTQAPTSGRKFAWRCRVSVPGGGLIERKGEFDFEAPSDGYEESVEITIPQDAEQWTSQQQRNYFVRLQDNRYARVNFRMIAGGNHYFILESFLNPKPGSRNLEFDPSKKVEPTPPPEK